MRRAFVLLVLVACGGESSPPVDGPVVDPQLCPAQHEVCIVYDGGWDVWCEAGAVKVDDLTATGYCAPGTTDPVVCQTGGRGDAQVMHTCASGCADTTVHYLETFGEYSAFSLASLCN